MAFVGPGQAPRLPPASGNLSRARNAHYHFCDDSSLKNCSEDRMNFCQPPSVAASKDNSHSISKVSFISLPKHFLLCFSLLTSGNSPNRVP